MEYRVFQIDAKDNVATALTEIPKGEQAEIIGESSAQDIIALDAIPVGHKIALREIQKDEPIIKYGVVIGSASTDIARGTWVHLHVMHSNYDERSSHLDAVTGAPKDTKYE